MKYCRKHDLAFCVEHVGQCLADNCKLEDEPLAKFCAVCCKIIRPAKVNDEKKNEQGRPAKVDDEKKNEQGRPV